KLVLHGSATSIDEVDRFAEWASDWGLSGVAALVGADLENGGAGDGYNNLAEYALGMDPTLSDAGSRDWAEVVVEEGTTWFDYIHYRRSDYAAEGLSYWVIDSTNLLGSVSFTNSADQIIVGPAVDGYEPVTNRYEIDLPERFIQLMIQQD
uniref:hypothetical protein n=1 Tax=Pontiella sp. TaxID=2837462 RepID=UPI0035629126